MKQWIRVKKALLLSLILLMAWLLPLFQWNGTVMSAAAISTDYPAQLMHLASKDSAKVLTANGTSDEAALSLQTLGSDLSASWRFDRVGSDGNGTFFKLVNAQSGRLLTPRNYNVSDKTDVILYGSESAQSQHWYVVPVKQDHLGNDLYYKIVNYSDTSLALTQGTSGMTLAKYSGTDNQLWLLNADGLQGFAGYCFDDNTGNIKTGDIGGLFGEIVEVSTFADLKKYATADIPYTIVVTANIRVAALQKDSSGHNYCPDGRIYVHSNKTIIGSYAAHTMYNVQFCTSSNNGTGNNLILKNFELQHDAESNGNDSIVVYLGSGQNIWVDHCTFVGHSDYNTASTGLPDWDKFLACCYDADYTTVSDCSFGLHEYGVILGYPADDENSYKTYNNYPRMSIISNRFEKTLTRGPGLMRYGYFHSLNNYVKTFSMAYTVHTASKIFAENCYYEDGGNVICDWNTVTYPGSYAETGSKSVNCKRTTIEGYAQDCTWRPTSNYKTISRTADEAKVYCENYSGCQNDRNHMMYLRYAVAGVPSASYTESPSAPLAELFAEGSAYRIRNVNSGLYLQVAGAAAKNGTNVQQWGSDEIAVHDIWKLYSAGEGYYYLVSAVGDGGTYVLDVAEKKAANGTNIDIYTYNGGDNQKFMLTKNGDGSYQIRTHISNGNSVVEVENASQTSGANVQQWEVNGANCQNWILEPTTDPGCSMNTDVIYTFENAGSGLVMDITDGKMTDNTNVQQWSSNGLNCQKWTLRAFGSGNYYWIRSQQDSHYALKAEGSKNGGNLAIAAWSNKDSTQLFRFTKNLDGSYSILTHASSDSCYVEVADASTANGANVQQWEPTGSSCQKWQTKTETTTVTTKVTTTVTTTTTTKATTNTTTAAATSTTAATATEPPVISGDINADGKTNLADVVLLQKWLLGFPETKLANWQAGDLNADRILNGFDLCLLRNNVI
ncbi:RICIN domain-containing protein [uncultured Ruminococcus sp.]|uniref:RICIN domain-containing protein n=1 Tax=uncultured Ruminococcus sp. TaxID=165186 RepID=UPI002665EE96|nr:RICIN domain-containing protein [uncultured Ruminococcus sp.]